MGKRKCTLETLEILNYSSLFRNAYKGKKVFLTGHTGFKGSWLLCWLHSLGAIVKGYALVPEQEFDLYNLVQGDSLCQSTIADLRDKERLRASILEFQPDYIFHLAAQSLVRYSYEQPVQTFETNVNGTLNLLEALRNLTKPCAVVIVTTDKVYFNDESCCFFKEDDKLGGKDPYSASKACTEILTDSYRSSFFNPTAEASNRIAIATARAGNVIGGGDWAKDRILPDIVRALAIGKKILVRNPEAIRPWQHVLEPLSGYLLLGMNLMDHKSLFESAWNFGPAQKERVTVREVVETVIQCWGSGEYESLQLLNQPHEAATLQLDASKANILLHWKPVWNTAQAISQSIAWYKHAAPNYREYTLKQIEAYNGAQERQA